MPKKKPTPDAELLAAISAVVCDAGDGPYAVPGDAWLWHPNPDETVFECDSLALALARELELLLSRRTPQ
jgi:hypothetical protein